MHIHRQGLLACDQCGKTFEYPGSLSNHMKVHSDTVYVCEVQNCGKENKSYAMHLEHVQFGHTAKPMIECKNCLQMFFTPTQMHSHHNKAHGPVQKNN